MRTIIIYNSQTGFTEQYANWIAKALDCPSKSLKQTTAAELSNYDRVIFGGWIMGDKIMGLDKLCQMTSPSAVFAVGSTPAYEEVVEKIRNLNQLEQVPLFYMEGGFRLERLGFLQRTLLKTLKKATAKKENRSRQEEFMLQNLGESFDNSDEKKIEELVKYLEE